MVTTLGRQPGHLRSSGPLLDYTEVVGKVFICCSSTVWHPSPQAHTPQCSPAPPCTLCTCIVCIFFPSAWNAFFCLGDLYLKPSALVFIVSSLLSLLSSHYLSEEQMCLPSITVTWDTTHMCTLNLKALQDWNHLWLTLQACGISAGASCVVYAECFAI